MALSSSLPFPPEEDRRSRFPILVGFTGQRVFAPGDADRNASILQELEARLEATVRLLNRKLRLTPKLLVCGYDAGADLVAATVALRSSTWSVLLMRAFDDYEPDRQARDAYQQLLRREPGRVALRTMRHVHRVSFDDRDPDGADPANRMGLPPADPPGVSDGPHARFRSMHFEQFGLWLARYATILIAAYAPSVATTRAPKPGSVPRVVAFRRTGIPDRFASEVIGRSQELFTSSTLEEPDGGHVLWIDPATPGAEKTPFQVLRPMDAIYDRHVPSPTQSQASGAVYAAPFDYSPAGARGPCKGAAAPLDAALARTNELAFWYA